MTASDVPDVWISSADLAKYARVSAGRASEILARCAAGKLWRGSTIEVRKVPGAAGRGGVAYEARAASLPRAVYEAMPPSAVVSADQLSVWRTNLTFPDGRVPTPSQVDDAHRKLNIILPALSQPPRSHDRAATVDYISRTIGKSTRTIQNWIRQYETNNGLQGLLRAPSPNIGKQLVFISRVFDAACPFDEATKRKLADDAEKKSNSCWAAGSPGVHRVRNLVAKHIKHKCIELGWKGATRENCAPGLAFVRRGKRYGVLDIKRRNAKRYADIYAATIIRAKDIKPMDVVVGDVHHVDIYYRRADGTFATCKLIGWLDVATGRIFCTFLFLEKGRGVRQEDVVRSFVDMCMAWGIPRVLYLDNGSEFKFDPMIEQFKCFAASMAGYSEFMKVKQHSGELDTTLFARHGVVRAIPYTPRSKAIEAVFALLEKKYFCNIQGYIGGDRENPRRSKLGGPPAHWKGTEAGLLQALEVAIDLYHNEHRARGPSPNEKLSSFGTDWERYVAPEGAFVYAFSEEMLVMVNRGRLDVGKCWYYADELMYHDGERVLVRVQKWRREAVLARISIGRNSPLEWMLVPEEAAYAYMGDEGPKERGRRSGYRNDIERDMMAETDPVDLAAENRELAQDHATPVVLPQPIILDIDDAHAHVDAALKKSRAPRAVTLGPNEIFDEETGEIINLNTTSSL